MVLVNFHAALNMLTGDCQAEHPSYTLSALTAAGGVFGYMKARSIPSLAGGLAVSALYGAGGYLISQNRDMGFVTSLAASGLLFAASARRAMKLLPLPMGLSGLGLAAAGYYGNKVYRSRVGY